jgi:succinoglycan biosynthesis protein ExoM
MKKVEHITVCICTYKRPELLRLLLLSLDKQVTEGLFDYSIVIVDNDRSESARKCVESHARQSKALVRYYSEPEQNIALARNRAVENAKGEYVAFVDDDEFPNEDWLLYLYKAICEFNADGVLGPVRPRFTSEPPEWVIRGRFCERESFPTGFVIKKPESTRTGNVLLNRKVFDGIGKPFDPMFGRVGGEDVDFFRRLMGLGNTFVWCNEGCVNETLPAARYTRSYFLRRALLRGIANSKNVPFLSSNVLKSIVAFALYTPALPVLLLVRHDLFMKFLIKDCDHVGKLLALLGLEIMKERP